jgi:hypothetical protein
MGKNPEKGGQKINRWKKPVKNLIPWVGEK